MLTTQQSLTKLIKTLTWKSTKINTQINIQSTKKIGDVNVKIDGVKGDLDGLKGRVDRHDQRLDYLHDNIVDNSTRITVVEDGVKANAKDINVVGNIALENRQFIGNNKAAIDKNTKAIDELKGQVGTTI